MQCKKFSGIIEEIVERYPNIDGAEFLEQRLQIPRFKAEELAARIEKRYCNNATREPQKTSMYEKTNEPALIGQNNVYAVDSLSKKELEDFAGWLLEQLGYVVEQKFAMSFGVSFVAAKDGEKIAFLIIRCPRTHRVSKEVFLVLEQTQRNHGCRKSIVIATNYFTEGAVEKAKELFIELWDRDALSDVISEVKRRADMQVQPRFPPYQGSLLQSLLKLGETKDFLLEPKSTGKYDLHLAGVKYPLLTFQAQANVVVSCVFRIEYNEPVKESNGRVLIGIDGANNRLCPDDVEAYSSIVQYLEQFLE